MKSPVDQVVYSAIRQPNEDLNILYFGYNGIFEQSLAQYPYKFYVTHSRQTLKELPKSFTQLKQINQIPNRIDIDLVMCNDRGQVVLAYKVAEALHVHCLFYEHDLPPNSLSEKMIDYLNSGLPERLIRIVPDEELNEKWKLHSQCIPYNDNEAFNNIIRDIVSKPYIR